MSPLSYNFSSLKKPALISTTQEKPCGVAMAYSLDSEKEKKRIRDAICISLSWMFPVKQIQISVTAVTFPFCKKK